MIALRPYQQAAIDSVLAYWGEGGGNPLVDMATGLGKSVVIAKLTRDLLTEYPGMRVTMLVHVRELVSQNAQALLRIWPDAPLGIYSAGLGRKQRFKPITYASIQSIHRQDHFSIGKQDLILIDEAHLVPSHGEGMYAKFIARMRDAQPDLRVCGFTATPFRLDSGRLDRGDNRLFDSTVFSYGIRDGIDDGWLSPLISKATATRVETKGVRRSMGEFVESDLAKRVHPITAAAIKETCALGADRRSWLVFCTGVEHAHAVADALRAAGVSAATVTGQTPKHERGRTIREFKAGRIRALTNANVLTTGFDAPGTDLIVMLRPTLSAGLYIQMVGRGTRKAEGKENCLILDFAGNVRRHGPVDVVRIESKGGAAKSAEAGEEREPEVRAKECPTCHSYSPLNAAMCQWCGHEWPVEVEPKHEATADDTPILSREAIAMIPTDHPVASWSAARHVKFGGGSPDTMRVTYLAGLHAFNEWVCLEHSGPAQGRARRWWREHGGADPVPATVAEGLARFGELQRPDTIQARRNGKFFEVVGHKFRVKEAA